MGLALGIAHLNPLLGHLPGFDAAHRPPRRDHRKREALRLACHEPRAPHRDAAQEGAGTEVPILKPHVPPLHSLQDLPEHRALLRIAIFTGEHITDYTVRGLIDDERFPGQGAGLHLAQHGEAVLTGFNTIPIQNFHPIPWQPWGPFPIQLGESVAAMPCALLAHQFR